MTEDIELVHRVNRGIAWLDIRYPNWYNDIHLDLLDMSNGTACVLGQVTKASSWTQALRHGEFVTVDGWYDEVGHDKSASFGFASASQEDFRNVNPRLEALWREAINKRRADQSTAEQTPAGGIQAILATDEEILRGFSETPVSIYSVTINNRNYRGTWDALKSVMSDLTPGDYEVTAK